MTVDELKVESRKLYLRPLVLAIMLSILGELLIFLVFGAWLYPTGSLGRKFLWAVLFCGLGMGASLGAMVDLLVVGRIRGLKAVLATTAISTALLGGFCNILCWRLDMHFHFFGGADNPMLFLGNGIVLSALAGTILGLLLFTKKGIDILDRCGL